MEVVIASAIVFGAGFCSGFTGFGALLFVLPLMSFLYPVKVVIGFVMLLGLANTIIQTAVTWRYIEIPLLIRLVLGAAAGAPVGVFLLDYVSGPTVAGWFAVFLIAFALFNLFVDVRGRCIASRWAPFFGVGAGLCGGLFGAPGPPVVIYVTLRQMEKLPMKATLQSFFLIMNIYITAMYTYTGIVTMQSVTMFGTTVVPQLAGLYAGTRLFKRLGSGQYRRVVQGMLLILGVTMLVRNWVM